MNHIPVYVINLPEATDRRVRIEEHLAELQISNVHFVSAIRGSALSSTELQEQYDDQASNRTLGRSMLPGEIGCALSHLKAYKRLLESDEEYALIIEDDAQLSIAAGELIGNVRLGRWLVSDKPRVVMMTTLGHFLHRFSMQLNDRFRIVKVRHAWFTHGYIINRAAAEKLMACNQPLKYLADNWREFAGHCSLDIRGVDPFCIGLDESAIETQIESSRHLNQLHFSPYGYARLYFIKIVRRLVEAFFYKPIYGFGSHDRESNQ